MSWPDFAAGVGISESTLKRYAKRFPSARARDQFLRTLAEKAGLPPEFFTADFSRLAEIAPCGKSGFFLFK